MSFKARGHHATLTAWNTIQTRGYDKTGYEILDPSEENMHYDVKVLCWNAQLYKEPIEYFTNFAFLKRMQMINTTQEWNIHFIYWSRCYNKKNCELDPCMFVETNNRQGKDLFYILPGISNLKNIYNSSSNRQIKS